MYSFYFSVFFKNDILAAVQVTNFNFIKILSKNCGNNIPMLWGKLLALQLIFV